MDTVDVNEIKVITDATLTPIDPTAQDFSALSPADSKSSDLPEFDFDFGADFHSSVSCEGFYFDSITAGIATVTACPDALHHPLYAVLLRLIAEVYASVTGGAVDRQWSLAREIRSAIAGKLHKLLYFLGRLLKAPLHRDRPQRMGVYS